MFNYTDMTELEHYMLKDSQYKSITTIDFTPKGDFLVAGDELGNAIIWDTADVS